MLSCQGTARTIRSPSPMSRKPSRPFATDSPTRRRGGRIRQAARLVSNSCSRGRSRSSSPPSMPLPQRARPAGEAAVEPPRDPRDGDRETTDRLFASRRLGRTASRHSAWHRRRVSRGWSPRTAHRSTSSGARGVAQGQGEPGGRVRDRRLYGRRTHPPERCFSARTAEPTCATWGAWEPATLQKTLASLHRGFQPLVRKTPPFADPPRIKGVTGSPSLVAQVAFHEWTDEAKLRQRFPRHARRQEAGEVVLPEEFP